MVSPHPCISVKNIFSVHLSDDKICISVDSSCLVMEMVSIHYIVFPKSTFAACIAEC